MSARVSLVLLATLCSTFVVSTGLSTTSFVNAHALEEKTPVYRHIVLFSFQETATPEQVQGVVDAFQALPGKIGSIKGFEMGTNVSPENLNKGFTHGFLVTFENKAGLEEYLPHPDHKAFGSSLKGVLKDVLVFDFVAQ